jgi:succinyl-diaminopimelate desuccinylase
MTTLSQPDAAAGAPVESIVDLTRDLVRIPSRAERDDLDLIVVHLHGWLEEHGLPVGVLTAGERKVGVIVTTNYDAVIERAVALNACLDTAGFGDEGLWAHDPTGAEIEDGWLYGRGAADSKVAAAMFAHLAVELAAQPIAGRLHVLFDVDEHSGRFGGAKAFQRIAPPLKGMMIGYPGNYGVVAGARGFWRANITTWGQGAHSGSTSAPRVNAVSKAARLVAALEEVELPDETDAAFPFGPSLTVTAVHGGEGYSQVPDRCDVKVDVRLTPTFGAEEAKALVMDVVAKLDAGTQLPSGVGVEDSWPAYRLADDEPVVAALRRAGSHHLGRDVPAVTCGPSNIGNFMRAHGIPATCGFGVTYRNIHATDEAIELASIEPVYRAYRDAVLDLLAG